MLAGVSLGSNAVTRMVGVFRVKICGVTTPEDAVAAVECGADAIGLNFYRGSPRYVEPSAVAAILREIPSFVTPVGVFVETPFGELITQMNSVPLHAIQWHGRHTLPPAHVAFPLIPAFAVRDTGSLTDIHRYLEECEQNARPIAGILIDAHVPGQFGGTGKIAPWKLLADFQPGVPLILAGGLTPENVAQAVKIVQPYAVDVASGVESAPGRKDRDKMRRFIDNARRFLS